MAGENQSNTIEKKLMQMRLQGDLGGHRSLAEHG